MKLLANATKNVASETLAVSKMGMSMDSADLFTYYLRDKIYTDKILAPIREYITNALDEHRKYGIQESVKVSIESKDGQWVWKCRDFAKGLSEEGIRNIFAMYGESTKRDCNTQAGMFGVGSKSAFAFTDTFYVRSFHNGVEYLYCCTLGAGDGGVSVGECYKISENPTDETGLEVSFDLLSSAYDFSNKTLNFVQTVNGNVEFFDGYNLNEQITRAVPLESETIDDITVNYYDTTSFYSLSSVNIHVRMGDVVYKLPSNFVNRFSSIIDDKVALTHQVTIIVDVPIGTFTLPLSREFIKDTKQNLKEYDRVKDVIRQIVKRDLETVQKPSLGEFLMGDNRKSVNVGKHFLAITKDIFPDLSMVARRILLDYGSDGKVLKNANDKVPIYIFPNERKHWKERFRSINTDTNGNPKAYLYIYDSRNGETVYDKLFLNIAIENLDMSDVEFIRVKTLPLPKIEKSVSATKDTFQVNYGGKIDYYTADELHDYVTSAHFDDVEDPLWYEKVDEFGLLGRKTFASYGTGNYYYVRSQKMRDSLAKLGWIDKDSSEWKTAHSRIRDLKDEKRRKEGYKEDLNYQLGDLFLKERTLNILLKEKEQNKRKYYDKIRNIRSAISNEDSFRGRMFKQINRYCSLSREDIRKLLKIK